jgi:ribonuclease HI
MPLIKYYLVYQIDKNEIDGACRMNGESRGAYSMLVRKPEGMRLLGRPRCRWEGNNEMDLQEMGCVP